MAKQQGSIGEECRNKSVQKKKFPVEVIVAQACM